MDESERKQLAERIHGYSSMPGIPEQIQNDLIAASVLIYSGKAEEEPQQEIKKESEKETKVEDYSRFLDSQPMSLKYLGPDGFDYIGFAKELNEKHDSLNFDSIGIDPENQSR